MGKDQKWIRYWAVVFVCYGVAVLFCGDAKAQSEHAQNPVPCIHLNSGGDSQAFSFPFSYTGELFGNFSGGYRQGAVYEGILKMGLQLELEKVSGWKGATFLVTGLYPHGSSLTDKYVRDFNRISNIDAPDSLRLLEAWLEQTFLGEHLSVRVGQMLADAEFSVCNSCCLFINGAFGAIPVWSANTEAPVYPQGAPGVRIRGSTDNHLFAQLGVFTGVSGDPSANNQHGTRFFHGNRGVLFLGEIGRTFNAPPEPTESRGAPEKSPRPLSGTFVLGALYDSARLEDQNGRGSFKEEYAFYVMADQELWHEREDSNQGLSIFARTGAAPQDRSVVESYVDTGFNYRGLLPGRDQDVCGIGLSYTGFGNNFPKEEAQAPHEGYEAILEVAYQAALSEWLSLQPDLQYIFNPSGIGSRGDALVLGIRLSLAF